MTNQQHPITPSPELLQDWGGRFYDQQLTFDELVTEVYKAGADQELEACAEWTSCWVSRTAMDQLRAARRPKPPSPKEEALQVVENLIETRRIIDSEYQALRHALEQLND